MKKILFILFFSPLLIHAQQNVSNSVSFAVKDIDTVNNASFKLVPNTITFWPTLNSATTNDTMYVTCRIDFNTPAAGNSAITYISQPSFTEQFKLSLVAYRAINPTGNSVNKTNLNTLLSYLNLKTNF